MRKILLLAQRELASYFASPIAYILGAVFFLISSHFFYVILSRASDSSMRMVFSNIMIVLLFIAPLLTMKLFAEEKKIGTMELLRTSPLTSWQIVLGKYLAVMGVFLALLATTLVYVVIIYWVGKPEFGILISGYIGLFLVGSAWMAAGLYTSSLTENQIISAVLAFVLLLLLWVLNWVEGLVGGWLGRVISEISILTHYSGFEKGIVDTAHVAYFLLFTFLFLFLSARHLEAERWS